MKPVWTALALMVACMAGSGACARPELIFSLDQGFGNGIVVHDDQVALTRIIAALKPLQSRYEVRVLLNPMVKDRAKLLRVLDTLAARQMPFVLDAWSSDAQTLGSCSDQNASHDPRHGLTASIEDLLALKKRYGRWFSGIRFTEVFAQDFTVRAVRSTNPEWGRPCWKMPEDSFFSESIAEDLLRFARQHGLTVEWSDWHWSRLHPWDEPQKKHEQYLRRLLKQYPGIVTVAYANNEPNEDSVRRLPDWEQTVKPFADDGAAGFGLSCQSWLRRVETETPAEDMIAWTLSALDRGAALVQYEPVWYFFRLPRGTFEVEGYSARPAWVDRGLPESAFVRLREALLGQSANVRQTPPVSDDGGPAELGREGP